jgi:hypothetical protein
VTSVLAGSLIGAAVLAAGWASFGAYRLLRAKG